MATEGAPSTITFDRTGTTFYRIMRCYELARRARRHASTVTLALCLVCCVVSPAAHPGPFMVSSSDDTDRNRLSANFCGRPDVAANITCRGRRQLNGHRPAYRSSDNVA